jgi:hypothetical protein
MSRNHRSVCQDDVVADDAVMRHVDIAHQVTVGTDAGPASFAGPAVQGSIFPDFRPVPDLACRVFVSILQVLRPVAHNRTMMDGAVVADACAPPDQRIGRNPCSVSDNGVVFDYREWTDGNIGAEVGVGTDPRIRIDVDTHAMADVFEG